MRSATGLANHFKFLHPVSIHALLAECDRGIQIPDCPIACFNPRTPCGVRPGAVSLIYSVPGFQSTHSLRSATLRPHSSPFDNQVSIHALLAECDTLPHAATRRTSSFNPRTPCGVRPVPASCPLSCLPFQSTHSLRSATGRLGAWPVLRKVSIHALLAEGDFRSEAADLQGTGFNPRTPCGVRQGRKALLTWTRCFNPRTPCGVRPL